MPRPIPVGGKHKSRNFAIGLSGIDMTSADGFAYSLGRSITAAAASAGVGIAASEAGMGGFVSSIAASLAGAAVNQATQDRQGLGLGSNGNVSYGRDGKEFKAINVEFDQAEFNRVIEGVKAKVFGRALDEEMSVPEAVEAVEQKVAQFVEEVKVEQAKVEETAEKINENEVNLRKEITESIGVESVQKFIEEGSLSEENRQYVIQILSKAIMKLTKQKNELNFRSSTPKNESQQASLQARNELIDEKMQQYSQLNNFLICSDQPKIVRSNSLDNLLEDTFIRRSQRALGTVTSVLGGVINEANSNSRDDYLELQLSRLPKERHNNPELLAQIEMGRMLFKGVTKVGEGISALDDATGNIVSGALRKIDEGAEWLGTHTRRFVRDNLGLGQRIGQNTGDIVKIISGIFVPGTALKALEQTKVIGVAKFKTVLGEKFGLYKGDVSAVKIGLDWNGPSLGKDGYGMAFENYIATKPEFAEIRLPKNFKTFDFWEEQHGRAVSVKTLNTNDATYSLKPSNVYGKIKGYINETLEFTQYDKGLEPAEVNASMIKTREIQLGIPANTEVTQMSQIQRAVEYGKRHNVDVIVTKIGK